MKNRHTFMTALISHSVLALLTFLSLFPFVLLVIASFTDNTWATAHGFHFFPEEWSLSAYQYILRQWSTIGHSYLMTFLVTIIGTAGSIVITALFAYALSHMNYPGIRLLNFLCIFTMLFNGGIVASFYCWVNIFHIKNTLGALIFPSLFMNAFNVILVKNYFTFNIPPSLVEAARIDGAGEFKIFRKVVLPLSVPIIATIGLMTAIAYWNDWTNGLYFLSARGGSQFYTIQLVLNTINDNISFLSTNASALSGMGAIEMPTTTVRMAIAVVGIIPIILAYPFFQKFFVKGITMGGVKE